VGLVGLHAISSIVRTSQWSLLPSGGWAGLQLFTLAMQTKKDLDNSSSCFDNFQH